MGFQYMICFRTTDALWKVIDWWCGHLCLWRRARGGWSGMVRSRVNEGRHGDEIATEFVSDAGDDAGT